MVGRQGREISDAVKGETGGSEAERKKIKRRSVGRSVGRWVLTRGVDTYVWLWLMKCSC